MGSEMCIRDRDYIEFNEITMDLQIPLIWQASLILTGIAVAMITALVLLLRDISRARYNTENGLDK